MASETALGIAARLWTHPATDQKVMDSVLAEVFAEKIDTYIDLLESAWGVIANAHHGDWREATTDWQDAARRWRDQWHGVLERDFSTLQSKPNEPDTERVERLAPPPPPLPKRGIQPTEPWPRIGG